MKRLPVILIWSGILFAQNRVPTQRMVPQQQPLKQQPLSFDCAADGSVFNAMTGEPVPRALVALASTTTRTDPAGKWSMANAPCGQVQLVVTRPGFLPGGNSRVPAMIFRPIVLASGSPAHDIRIELTPQSVITGKVVDSQGDAVPGAQLNVLAARVTDGRLTLQSANSEPANDLGEFRIAGLQSGRYMVCARVPPGNSRAMWAESCYPAPPEAGPASAIELAAGHETRIDFTLTEASFVHVRGTVNGSLGRSGAQIKLIRRGAVQIVPQYNSGTRQDGKFDIPGVGPGSYTLLAQTFDGPESRLSALAPVEVGTSDVDGIVVSLESGMTLRGTVRTQSGSAVPANLQAGLNLQPAEPQSGNPQLRWAPDHTSFTFTDVIPGNYKVNANSAPPFYVKSATLAGQDLLHATVAINAVAGPLEIVLADDGGSIEGDAVNSDGQPAPSGLVLLDSAGRLALSTQTEGHFTLPNVAPGDYSLHAWDNFTEAQYADPDWMRRYGGSGVPVTVAAGQKTQVKAAIQSVPPL